MNGPGRAMDGSHLAATVTATAPRGAEPAPQGVPNMKRVLSLSTFAVLAGAMLASG